MIKEIKTTEPVQITYDIKAYAEGLSAGVHYAWTATVEGDIGQPIVGTGFMYEIKKYASSPIQITAIAFSGNNNLYLLRKHGPYWRPWVVFEGSQLGGGNTSLEMSPFRKRGGVDAGRVSEHSWSDKLHNVPHEAGFSAVNEFVKDIYHTLLSSGSSIKRDHRTPSINPIPAHGVSSKRLGWNYSGISVDVKRKSLQVGAYEWGLERLDRDVNATRKGVV